MNNRNAILKYAEKRGMTRVEAVGDALRVGKTVKHAAKIIGISRVSLSKFIIKYGVREKTNDR